MSVPLDRFPRRETVAHMQIRIVTSQCVIAPVHERNSEKHLTIVTPPRIHR